jgi:hypothetical protein
MPDVKVMNSVSGTSLARHHYKAAGHRNDMNIRQRGNPWPDMNIMGMVKYNNEMASFVVNVQQPLPVLRC